MKRLILFLICLLTLSLVIPACGEDPLPGYMLADLPSEVKVYALPSLKANIAGYILPDGQQEVCVLRLEDDWCYVRFSSIHGDGYGYVPRSCFVYTPAATPTPSAPQTYVPGTSAMVRNTHLGYRLNLRAAASATAASYGKYYTGVDVTLTGAVNNGFAQVMLDTLLGWMDIRCLETEGSVMLETPVVTVKNPGGGVNLRVGPGTGFDLISWYPDGTAVTVLGACPDGWYHVEINRQTGFVAGHLLSDVLPFEYGTDSDHPGVSGSLNANGNTMYVNTRTDGSQLNLRKEPSASSKAIGRFYTGTPVELISYTRTGWAYVRVGQLEGYMDADYLTVTVPKQYGQVRMVRNPYGTGMNLREYPDTQSAVIAFLKNYTAVTVLGDLNENWCYVQSDGVWGYILGTRLQPAK